MTDKKGSQSRETSSPRAAEGTVKPRLSDSLRPPNVSSSRRLSNSPPKEESSSNSNPPPTVTEDSNSMGVRTASPPPVTQYPLARKRQDSIAPPNLDVLEERYADLQPEDQVFSAEEAIDRQIASLEAWTRANVWRERVDLARFWLLRGVAFAGAILAGMAGYLPDGSRLIGLLSGSVTVVALAIDAAWPISADRVTRRRAIRELRELQNMLTLRWDKVRLAHPQKYSVKRIAHGLALLDMAQAKREEIGKYLSDSSPGVSEKLS